MYLDHLQSRVESCGGGKVSLDAGSHELRLHLSQAEAANAQGRFRVALGKMKEAKGVCTEVFHSY